MWNRSTAVRAIKSTEKGGVWNGYDGLKLLEVRRGSEIIMWATLDNGEVSSEEAIFLSSATKEKGKRELNDAPEKMECYFCLESSRCYIFIYCGGGASPP